MTDVPLGELIRPAKVSRAGNGDYPLLSMTMRDGLVDQSAKFKKRVASNDVSDYKVVGRGQLVVGFPIDEGVLDFQTLYDQGIVSPAYGVWDLGNEARVHRPYLKRFLRSGRAMAYYRGKLRGSTARRRSLPAEVFLALPVPLPSTDEQRRIAAILDYADAMRTRRRDEISLLRELSSALYERAVADAKERTIQELLDAGALVVHKDGNHGSLYPRSEEFASEGVPFLTAKAVRDDGSISVDHVDHLRGEKASQLRIGWIRDGDVLLSHNASVGKVAVYGGQFGRALIGTSLTCFRADASKLRPDFLAASLRADVFQRQLKHDMAQTTRNQVPITAQRKLSLRWVEPQRQWQLVCSLKPVSARMAAVRRVVDQTDELFASLQSRAFLGEL